MFYLESRSSKMKRFFERLYQDLISHPESIVSSIISISAIFLSAAIAWWIFNAIVRKLERKYHDRVFLEKGDSIFILVKRAGHYTILILVGIVLVKQLQVPIVEKIFYAFMILILSSFANGIFSHLIPYLENMLAAKTETHIDDVMLGLAKRFLGVIIYATGFILALDVLGLNIMPFVAGAGVAGIAIGFAAKDTLSNLIAGILLIIDRPFEVGDRIEVWSAPTNSATWGDVIDIGLRATKIRTTDNIVIVIPNNEIMRRDIINYTTITKEIRVRVPIGIAYDADVKKAKAIITKISLELEWILKEPAPKVVVKSFGDSAVNLEARIWITEPRRRMDTISHITDRVKEEFQKEGIEIPYPKRDIFIKESKA